MTCPIPPDVLSSFLIAAIEKAGGVLAGTSAGVRIHEAFPGVKLKLRNLIDSGEIPGIVWDSGCPGGRLKRACGSQAAPVIAAYAFGAAMAPTSSVETLTAEIRALKLVGADPAIIGPKVVALKAHLDSSDDSKSPTAFAPTVTSSMHGDFSAFTTSGSLTRGDSVGSVETGTRSHGNVDRTAQDNASLLAQAVKHWAHFITKRTLNGGSVNLYEISQAVMDIPVNFLI